MTNFLKAIIMFIRSRETLLEVMLFIARQYFGESAINKTVGLVRDVSLEMIGGDEKRVKVKNIIKESVEWAQGMKFNNTKIDTMIQIVVLVLKVTGQIK